MKSAAVVALANLEVLETQNALGDFDDKWKSYDPTTKDYAKACSDTVKNVAESVNVVLAAENQGVVNELRKQLHAGWRGAALVEEVQK